MGRGILPIFFVLLAVLFTIFVCALGMTQSVQGHLMDNTGLLNNANLIELYGSLWSTMLTLFMAVSNGKPWHELLMPLNALSDGLHLFFFLFYIVIMKFGILNILLAVIVTFVTDMRNFDDQAVLDAKSEQLQSAISEFKEKLLDESVDGMISYKSFKKVLTGDGSKYPKQIGLQVGSM